MSFGLELYQESGASAYCGIYCTIELQHLRTVPSPSIWRFSFAGERESDNHVQSDLKVVFEGFNSAKSYNLRKVQQIKLEDAIQFRSRYTERSLSFFISESGGDWQRIEEVDTQMMTDFDFTGRVIGMFATGNGGEARFAADFEID